MPKPTTPAVTRRAFLGSLAAAALAASLPFTAAVAAPPAAAKPSPAAPPSKKPAPHPIATIVTVKGVIKVKLYPEEAPNTVANFIDLSRKKFFDGLTFHRVVPGFVIQGGDPKGNGSGGPGYSIKNENDKFLKHNVGAVAMANAGPDTAGSQFYIVITNPAPSLDEKDERGINKYTIFGQVISGQDVAEKIQVGDQIKTVTISDAPNPYPVKVEKLPAR